MAEGRQFLSLFMAMIHLFHLVQGEFRDCNNPLGMENGDIPDSNIIATVTSHADDPTLFGAHRARLKSSSGYRADPKALGQARNQSLSPSILVILPKELVVTGIATQGLGREWITEYRMFAVDDTGSYTSIKEFDGNIDGDTVKFNTVPLPVKTSEVLLVPTYWHENIALRLELYGCEPLNYFNVWLKVRNTNFVLRYMNLNDKETKEKKDLVLNQVTEYLKGVPGFLFVKLHKFSPPLYILDLQKDQVSMTAEMEIHCIASSTQDIERKLQISLTRQGDNAAFGTTILKIQHPVSGKCSPPTVQVFLGKDPLNPQLVTFDTTKKTGRTLNVAAGLDANCNITAEIAYSWEIAAVDRESGIFNLIYQFGKVRRTKNSRDEALIWKQYILPPGLQYIRCIARNADKSVVSSFTYDFGFFELVRMEPLTCTVTPRQGKLNLDKFTIRCIGGYKDMEVIGYSATLVSTNEPFGSITSHCSGKVPGTGERAAEIDPNKPLVLSNWSTPTGTITLPAGNPKEDYNVRVKMEAKYLAKPSLFDDVVVKVNILTKEVAIIENLLASDRHEEAACKLRILQTILDQTERNTTVKRKTKQDMIQSIMHMKIKTVQQLNQMVTFVIFSNKIKAESTKDIQENSLYILNMAVNFMNEQSARNVSNIDNTTKNLIQSADLVLSSATDDKNEKITRKATESIYDITDMRRRFLSSATGKDEVQLHTGGVSVLLVKTKIQSFNDKVLRIKRDEVHLPKDLFAGKWSDTLQSGSLQIIRFDRNPLFSRQRIIPRNMSALDITFWHNNDTKMKISNLSTPIRILFTREPYQTTDQGASNESLFLKKKEMRYHNVSIPSHEAVVTVRIKPEKNISLRVYVRYSARPTAQHHDLNVTLPNTTLSSCSKEGNSSCSPRDPYEFDLLPNVTGQIGRHVIGVEILQDSVEIPDLSTGVAGNDAKALRGQTQYCVKVKPAPTPLPVKKNGPRQFDSKTDVKYKLLVTEGTCVFWDNLNQKWSARGCEVAPESNETMVHCLTNHLSTFSGNFYVVPNKIDFTFIAGIQHLPPENMVVLCTICLIFVVYAVGLVFARRADNRDKMKVVNTKVISQKEDHSCAHNYEISIQTGMWHDNGTTASVSIILFGEEEISDTILFMDPWRERKLFTRGSVNTFSFDLPRRLGQVYKVKIWHDNGGKSPSWFLYEVVVKDVSTDERWHFVANRWLAVESADGAIEVEIQAASKRELTRFRNLFQWRAITSFADKHLFLSIFARPPQNPFTRCQRLTCMLSIILVSLVTNAMFYNYKKTKDPSSFQLGPLELSLTQIIIGVQSGLIALPVNIVTVMIFRNIKRNITPDSSKEIETSTSGRKNIQGFLPRWFIVVGWFICLTASVSSAVFAVLYSFEWGAEIANRWLLSVGVSLLQEILLTGPIIILFNTSVISLVNRKPTVNDEIKNMAQQANLVHVVQEDAGQVVGQKPSTERLLLARSLKLQQRKMRRFFINLMLYVTFVVLLMTVCYANRKPSTFRQTKSLKDTFSGFYQVKDAKSFWAWFEEELVPGLYDSRQAADGNETGMITSKIGSIVGLPRIRQMRIRQESTCKVFQVQPVLRTHFNQCLSAFSSSNKDTTPYYQPGWKPIENVPENPYHYQESCPEPWYYEEPMSVSEVFLPYGGGGYIAKLGYDASTALRVKESIEENGWIDERSAVVIVEFVVFEPANLLLSNVMLILEKYDSGMSKTTIDVIPELLFPTSGSAVQTFYRICILLWFIIILVFLITEIVRCIKQGRAYFKNFFSWVSMVQILSSFFALLMIFVKENSLKDFLQRIRDNPFGDWIAYQFFAWSSFQEVILSITVVTTTINCLKLIQINRHVHVMKWTLQSACRYLCSLAIIIVMLVLAFAQLGTLLFGAEDGEYATLYYSLRTVLKMGIGIGKIQFSKMDGSVESEVFAPIFLMACMLSMTIIFANTFIAILDDAFHEASGKEYPGDELGAYMKSYLVNRVKKSRRSVKRAFRKSAFRKSFRRKYTLQPSKRELQQKMEDPAAPQEERAKLAETESLLSSESLCPQKDFERMPDIQTTQAPPPNRRIENEEMDVLNISCALTRMKAIFKSLPTEEEVLLSDIAKIMKTVRSDFTRCLWEDEEWYNSRSSFSSSDDSFAELDKSASILSLIQTCQKDAPHIQTWSYVRGMERSQVKPIRPTLRPHTQSYTRVLADNYV